MYFSYSVLRFELCLSVKEEELVKKARIAKSCTAIDLDKVRSIDNRQLTLCDFYNAYN